MYYFNVGFFYGFYCGGHFFAQSVFLYTNTKIAVILVWGGWAVLVWFGVVWFGGLVFFGLV